MDELEFENNNVQSLIDEFYKKHKDDKFNITKFKKFLSENNCLLNDIYIQLIFQLVPILKNVGNSFSKLNIEYLQKEEEILNKILTIISESNSVIEVTDENNKKISDNFNELYPIIINIFIKFADLVKKPIYINDNLLKVLLDKFSKHILNLFKIIYDKDPKSLEHSIEKTDFYNILIKEIFTRNILYDILKIIMAEQKGIEINENEILNHKGSLKLINNIIEYLIKEIKVININDIILDIKTIVTIYKDHLLLIESNILSLLKELIGLFNSPEKMKAYFDDLFFFSFNNIVFCQNLDKKYNPKFLGILFKLYEYLLEQKNSQMIKIFLMQLFNSISYNLSNIKGLIDQRYEWLLKETEYKNVILNSLPIIFDLEIIAFYIGLLMNLINQNIIPEEDFIIFFKNFGNYLDNGNVKKEILIDFVKRKICSSMEINSKVCKIVLKKCKAFEILIKLIDAEKEKDIKIKLIELMEKLIAANKNDCEYSFELDIREDMDDDINYRLNIFTVGYEYNVNKYNKKIGVLINKMTEYVKNKNISEFIKLSDFIFKIISEKQFRKINEISEENVTNFNNLLLQISLILSNPDSNELEEFIQKFLDLIFKFIIQFNLKKFEYKARKLEFRKSLYYSKRIIKKKILKDIIKNLLLSQNHSIQKKTYEYLKLIAIDEKNNLIKSSYLIYIITKIYYQDKNYKKLQKIFDTLLSMIKKFQINAQILLYYDFVTIALNILQELYGKENEFEEYYKSTFALLEELSKYFNKNLLMTFLNKIFILFKKKVLSEIQEEERLDLMQMGQRENNEKIEDGETEENAFLYGSTDINEQEDNMIGMENDDILNNEEVERGTDRFAKLEDEKFSKNTMCLDLLGLLKNNFKENYEKENYLILSNYTFPNHLINNILYFDNLKCNEFDTYIGFKLTININSYKGINGFILLQVIRQKNCISFIINNNTLEIKESINNKESIFKQINNFNKICPEGKYHEIILNFETKAKTIEMRINDKIIIEKSTHYKDFIFDEFSAIIGFSSNLINYKTNNINFSLSNFGNNSNIKNNKDNNDSKSEETCFVYISYFLIVSTLIDEKLFKIFEKEKSLLKNQSFLNCLYKSGMGNVSIGKTVLSEIEFQNQNMSILYCQNIPNRINPINNFFLLDNVATINRYISCKKFVNNFKTITPNKYIYLIAKNNNICEFCSLNEMWELEKINKQNINSKLFDNFYTKTNLIQPYIIDFLFGFFFLIERRYNELKKQNKENNEQKEEEETKREIYFTNEDMVLDYILEIFGIIFLFPGRVIEKYFNEINVLKLKFFFYRNIFLFKEAIGFFEDILNLFGKNEILFLVFISEIFFDINIFKKLDSTIQNNIMEYLIKFLDNIDITKEYNYHRDMFDCIINLMNSCLNIILLTQSTESTIKSLIECINIIIVKIASVKLDKKKNVLEKIFYEINYICSNFEGKIKEHIINKDNKDLYKKNNDNISDEGESNKSYLEKKREKKKEKMNKLFNQIIEFYKLTMKNKNIISLINNYDHKNEKKCPVCTYFKKLVHEKSKFIYAENTYIKLYNRFFRNYYQNFGDNPDIFNKNNYVWFLSLKESGSKMQNKLFLKENRIKDHIYENPNTKAKTLYFKYALDEEYYMKQFKKLNNLCFYEKIYKVCENEDLIKAMNPVLETKNYYNCLIINKLHKIISTFVLYEDRIELYFNICLDIYNKLHLVKKATTKHVLWMKTQNEYKNELRAYMDTNEKEIEVEIYDNKKKDKNIKQNLSSFNYNYNYKFIRRTIYLRKINEIHKKDHLHIPNSLELFLDNGESYFLVFNPEIREKVFENIIKNIDSIYKQKSDSENKIPIFISSKIQALTNNENIFYMKHTPLAFLSQSETDNFLKKYINKKNLGNKTYIKSIVDGNLFKENICNYWAKNKITNYDYIMLLNTLAGRTLNDLSQYYIFPWIIQDFNKDILNWLSSSIFRDLSLPIYACGNDIEKIKDKYELLDDEKYHSGTFYSAHSFVCYYLVRLHPFTEIHLEIQGARFDARPRMFNGVQQLSEIAEKFQELIPHLYYFPEMYIKLNYILEDINSDEETMSDFELPSWCKEDPRKFSLILRKLLESEKVSEKLHQWFDLIFGYLSRGPNAEKAMNTYRECVYYPSKTELEHWEECGEIESYLYEKEELGCIGKQLFTKAHKNREMDSENKKFKKIFFNTNERKKQLILKKIKGETKKDQKEELKKETKEESKKISKEIKNMPFKKYNDIIFPDIPSMNHTKSIYQGGISSLPSLMSISQKKSSNKIKKEEVFRNLVKDENFFILKKNYFFLSKFCLILTYNNKFIEIINIKGNDKESKYFLLEDDLEISCLTMNSKGTKIFVGFTNGQINQYKITNIKINDDNSYIQSKFQYTLGDQNDTDIFNEYIFNITYFSKEEINSSNIYLKLLNQNNFNDNNPHFYKRINLLGLNEAHNVLIVLDQSNTIYILSLNNNFKLMHKISYLSKTQIKMKEIIPLEQNGDFIIYSSYSVYLFSINGVPLCSLNLFEKGYEGYSSISCCRAVFIYDITLFTTHKDGFFIIWKIKNKDVEEKNLDSFMNDDNDKSKNKKFLKEYKYAYNYRNYMNSGIKLNEFELRRKFEEIDGIKIPKDAKNKTNSIYFNFMKMSNDMSYMILLDNDKNVYILTNIEDFFNKKKGSFMIMKKSKPKCMHCGKELIDFGIRPSLVPSRTLDDYNNLNSFNQAQKSSKNKNNICEECMKMIQHTENYLYSN